MSISCIIITRLVLYFLYFLPRLGVGSYHISKSQGVRGVSAMDLRIPGVFPWVMVTRIDPCINYSIIREAARNIRVVAYM